MPIQIPVLDSFQLHPAAFMHNLVPRTRNRRTLIRGALEQKHVSAEDVQH